MSVHAATDVREMSHLLDREDEQVVVEPLSSADTKVSLLRESLFCSGAGAIVGGGTATLIAGFGYVNSGIAASFIVAGIAGTGASALGALVGTCAKRVLANAEGCRIVRGGLGAFALCSSALGICNVAAWGQPNLIPMSLWSQFAIGVPMAVAGFTVGAAPRTPEMGAIAGGGLVSLATGAVAGMVLGGCLGLTCPAIGPAAGAMYGITGIQAVGGYACFPLVRKQN